MLLEKPAPPSGKAFDPDGLKKASPSSPPSPPEKFSGLSGALLVFIGSILISGMFFLKENLGSSWMTMADQFKTLVLVSGSEIELDEVGAALRRAENVVSTRFVSPEEGFRRFQESSISSTEGEWLTPELVPAAWEVTWKFDDGLTRPFLEDLKTDLETFPSVLAVGLDWRQWDVISNLRQAWLNARLFTALFLFSFCFAGLFLLGKNLFFKPLRKIPFPIFCAFIAVDSLAWALGYVAAFQILGPVSPHLLWGGPLVGLFHLSFVAASPAPGSSAA